jgi:ankyrin repeat protein
MIASHKGYIDIVKHVLEAPGIELDVTSSEGQTALFYASGRGHSNIFDLLLAFPPHLTMDDRNTLKIYEFGLYVCTTT